MNFSLQQKKPVSRDAAILRYMRLSKRLSLTKAGALVRITNSAIAHIEQGRMEVSKARIETLVEAYGFTMADFMEFHDGKRIPVNLCRISSECTTRFPIVYHPCRS